MLLLRLLRVLLVLLRAVAMEEDDLRRLEDEAEGTAKYRLAPGGWAASIVSCELLELPLLPLSRCKFVLGAKV